MLIACSVPDQIRNLSLKEPHATALRSGKQTVSYAYLHTAAEQFARYLGQVGVVQGGTVAICMERSCDWIIAALGAMYAGAAYVPLDLAWPGGRLRFALEDSGADVVVARAEVLKRLDVKLQGIDPDRDGAAILAAPFKALKPIEEDSLAYVIYTSGSSGTPKGVEITHANLAHLAKWHVEAFHLTAKDRSSHLAGLGFDAAAWEIWATLAAGATLCIADDAIRSSPDLIKQWILNEEITVSFVPTVHAASLMAVVWPASTPLRLLLTGGEALLHGPPRTLPFAVVNNYGPTECTVVATSTVLVPESTGAPPIGRPIAGTRVFLLDEQRRPVADGTTGEIYIAGAGVGRGYRNLPQATADSFIPDFSAEAAEARMYRTGDRGVRRPDGQIEFKGRADRQVKIRGYRIELDEIGAVLTAHPQIRFATAVVLKSARGEDQIIAYVLPEDESAVPAVKALQDHLIQSLPEYMVPVLFIRLDTLPLSANGKIDLKLLQLPSEENTLESTRAKLPSTPTEKELLVLAQELLNLKSVTIEDNFFLAGGHSLLSMQLVLRLRKMFDVNLSLNELFGAPTVEGLAVVVDRKLMEQRLAAMWRGLLNIAEVDPQASIFELGGTAATLKGLQEQIAADLGRNVSIDDLTEHDTIRKQVRLVQEQVTEPAPDLPRGVLPLRSHATHTAIFWVHYLSANLARAMADDQAFIHLGLVPEDIAALGPNATLPQIAACFVAKILATKPQGPYIIGGYCLGGILAYEISAQLVAAGHQVPLLVMLDTPSPSYYKLAYLLAPRLRHPRYLLKRLTQVGFRSSYKKIRNRIMAFVHRTLGISRTRTETETVQHLIEVAAASYEAAVYRGKVSLILASDHPPHIDFLSEWREFIPNNLHSQYMVAHHSELIQGSVVQAVANAMASQIKYAADVSSFELLDETQEGSEPQMQGARPVGETMAASR